MHARAPTPVTGLRAQRAATLPPSAFRLSPFPPYLSPAGRRASRRGTAPPGWQRSHSRATRSAVRRETHVARGSSRPPRWRTAAPR